MRLVLRIYLFAYESDAALLSKFHRVCLFLEQATKRLQYALELSSVDDHVLSHNDILLDPGPSCHEALR